MGSVFYYVHTLQCGGAVLFSFRNGGGGGSVFSSLSFERLRAVFVFLDAKDEIFPPYILGTRCKRA
jgi:hypothetical protein